MQQQPGPDEDRVREAVAHTHRLQQYCSWLNRTRQATERAATDCHQRQYRQVTTLNTIRSFTMNPLAFNPDYWTRHCLSYAETYIGLGPTFCHLAYVWVQSLISLYRLLLYRHITTSMVPG